MTVCLTNPAEKNALNRYDWTSLYNVLSEIKLRDGWSNITHATISADPQIHYQLVVATMDTMRCRLEKDRYDSADEFQRADPGRGEDRHRRGHGPEATAESL